MNAPSGAVPPGLRNQTAMPTQDSRPGLYYYAPYGAGTPDRGITLFFLCKSVLIRGEEVFLELAEC